MGLLGFYGLHAFLLTESTSYVNITRVRSIGLSKMYFMYFYKHSLVSLQGSVYSRHGRTLLTTQSFLRNGDSLWKRRRHTDVDSVVI